jgi:hypothetical protein
VPTRADWQQLAEERILDARAHLAPGAARWSAAYYLAGYAVECGLKSCILARVGAFPEVIFEDKRFSQDAWSHDVENLVRLAGLEADRDAASLVNPVLHRNWQIARTWNEQSRYMRKTQAEAQQLFDAITDPAQGVMQWIRARW